MTWPPHSSIKRWGPGMYRALFHAYILELTNTQASGDAISAFAGLRQRVYQLAQNP
jgi:hypothetical protein